MRVKKLRQLLEPWDDDDTDIVIVANHPEDADIESGEILEISDDRSVYYTRDGVRDTVRIIADWIDPDAVDEDD